MAQQRGHLARGGQARGGLQPLLLLARDLLDAALRREIEHRAHPAGVLPAAVEQRRLVDHGRKALPGLAHEGGLEGVARARRRHARHAPLLAALVLEQVLGRPVRRLIAPGQLLGVEADHRAERRIHVGRAALQIARAQAGPDRVLHRLAERQGVGQGVLGAGALAHVARQQHDDAQQRQRQSDHQAGDEIGHQARPGRGAVHAQLHRGAGQVDHAARLVDAGTDMHAAVREVLAVGLDERQVVARRERLGRKLVQQARQRIARDHEAAVPVGAALGDAQIHHLDPQAIGTRHEIAVRIGRPAAALRGPAGEFGFQLEFVAAHLAEQRRVGARVDGLDDRERRVAALEAQQLGPRQQQLLGARAPLPGRRVPARHREHGLQVLREQLGQFGAGCRRVRLDRFLGARRAVVKRQRDQQRLRRQQKRDQRDPQHDAQPARPRRGNGVDRRQGGGFARQGVHVEVGGDPDTVADSPPAWRGRRAATRRSAPQARAARAGCEPCARRRPAARRSAGCRRR